MANKTIKVKKYSDVIEEFVAGGTITPGMLIEVNSSGAVIAATGAGELPMFALEDELQGKGIDDDYTSTSPADLVQCWIPYRGDIVNAILKSNNKVVVGDGIASNGDGKVKKAGSSDTPIGFAVTAVDLTGSGASDARVLVRII
jgi:hypothetical protein